jgi:hypothetical protein
MKLASAELVVIFTRSGGLTRDDLELLPQFEKPIDAICHRRSRQWISGVLDNT